MKNFFEYSEYFYKKGKLSNTYVKVEQGEQNDVTHVIFPLNSFIELCSSLDKEQNDNEIENNKLLSKIKNYEQYIEEIGDRIKQSESILKDNEDLNQQNIDLENECERLRTINQNLVRIMKERANADRGLHPKKVRNGYSIRKSYVIDYTYKYGGNINKIKLFKTVLITPYETILNRTEAFQLILNDLFVGDDLHKPIFDNKDNESFVDKRYEDINFAKIPEAKNMYFNMQLVFNAQPKYWEVEFNHVNPLEKVPEGLSYSSNKKKNN